MLATVIMYVTDIRMGSHRLPVAPFRGFVAIPLHIATRKLCVHRNQPLMNYCGDLVGLLKLIELN